MGVPQSRAGEGSFLPEGESMSLADHSVDLKGRKKKGRKPANPSDPRRIRRRLKEALNAEKRGYKWGVSRTSWE